MKKIWLAPIFCILALCFVLIAPVQTLADDYGINLSPRWPVTTPHNETLEMTINLTAPVPHEDYEVMISYDLYGMKVVSASMSGTDFWELDSTGATSLTITFKTDGDAQNSAEAIISACFTLHDSGKTFYKTYVNSTSIQHEPGTWLIVKDPTCSETGLRFSTCLICAAKMLEEIPKLNGVLSTTEHVPGEWVVTTAPTNKTTGTQAISCTLCGITIETKTIPILREIWPDNTACSLGLRFRDEAPSLTDKWYMYTPVDVSQDGVQTFPLIASNVYIIGSVSVTVEDGAVTVAYNLDTKKIKVKEEFLTFFPDLASVEKVKPEELTELRFAFGEPIQLDEQLQSANSMLMFMRLVIDYDIYADGVVRYYESTYKLNNGI